MSWPRQSADTSKGQQPPARAVEAPPRVVELDAGARPGPALRLRPAGDAAPEADWSETVRMVHAFADQLRAAERRVAELEEAYRELSERAERELAVMTERLEHADACARDAGERRREAEEWLRRIHDAVHKRFGADMMVSIARDATRR